MRTEPQRMFRHGDVVGSSACGGTMSARPLAVYVHLPFCVKKCAYCDFLSFPPETFGGEAEDARRRYFDALLHEIDAAAGELPADAYEVRSVYFGGGTPSLMEAGQIAALLKGVAARVPFSADAEISLECNPGTADAAKLRGLRDAGANRLSIGVQSFDDAELRLLGRIHTAADAERCFAEARSAGFDNVNLDLMAALPGQRMEKFLGSVRRAVSLGPEHISLYSLMIEPGTPFYERYADEVPDPHYDRSAKTARGHTGENGSREAECAPHLPDEEAERAMLHAAWAALAEAGYARYEISNFARAATLRCLQNMTYWERGEYLGIGLGAASLIDGTRFSNTRDMGVYLAAFAGAAGRREDALARIREDVGRLSRQAQMEEFMFLGLRLTAGVSERRFSEAFGTGIDDIYGQTIGELTADGLLIRRDGRIFLTERGVDLSNYVMAGFLF